MNPLTGASYHPGISAILSTMRVNMKWERATIKSNVGFITSHQLDYKGGKFTVFQMRPVQGLRWVICKDPPQWGGWNIVWATNILPNHFGTLKEAKAFCEAEAERT